MEDKGMWPLALQALQALSSHYVPVIQQTAAQLKLPEWCTGILLPALSFDPEPVTAEKMRKRGAYTAESLYSQRLSEAARQELLQETEHGAGEYRLTARGREAAESILQAANECMSRLQPLPEEELDQLAALLNRVVQACLKAPSPPGKWCIELACRVNTGISPHLLVRIDHYLSDLSAYRDDAHLAAWQPHGCSGQAWEAFTLLWRGEARTLDELFSKLERRGFSREEYRQALDDLIQRGWLQAEGEQYVLTPRGEQIRQAAEEQTDAYFHAPWDCLSENELEALGSLLTRLREKLSGLIP